MYRRSILFRTGIVGCLTASLLVSACRDTKNPLAPKTTPSLDVGTATGDGSTLYDAQYPEGGKVLPDASGISSNNLGSSNALSVPTGGMLSIGTEASAYQIITVPFAPEPVPAGALTAAVCDDCYYHDIPLGFSFTFFGNVYDRVDFSNNALIGFARKVDHSYVPETIPYANPWGTDNNIIALAWSDWYNPAGGTIKYGTTGAAPNRRWILDFNNVRHISSSTGLERLTAQLILHEGSNDITMYITSMTLPDIPSFPRMATQGIENLAGTEAYFVPGRVNANYSMSNVAIRFTTQVANTAPSITPPADISFSTDGGVCARVLAQSDLGDPTVVDDGAYGTPTPVRGDALGLDAPYPFGPTTVTWSVTDAGGLSDAADQTITIIDTENPTIAAPGDVVINTDPGQPTGTFNPGTATSFDNCGSVTVTPPAGGAYPIGTTTVIWTATDASGNSAQAQQQVTVIDQENPVLTIPPSFTVNATMPGGAVVLFSATATDNSGGVTVECTPGSGSTYGIGTTTTNCTATDGSGNETRGSFTVTVLGAADQLRNLIAFVEALPNLPSGTENSLSNQARTALRHVAENPAHVSCVKLDDFIKKLHDHKVERDVSGANIALMEADAVRIKNVLGCSFTQS